MSVSLTEPNPSALVEPQISVRKNPTGKENNKLSSNKKLSDPRIEDREVTQCYQQEMAGKSFDQPNRPLVRQTCEGRVDNKRKKEKREREDNL